MPGGQLNVTCFGHNGCLAAVAGGRIFGAQRKSTT